jgi:predicted transcriptional regulator
LERSREELGVAQAAAAARMGAPQFSVECMEAGEIDPRLSVVDRHAAAIEYRVVWQPEPDDGQC